MKAGCRFQLVGGPHRCRNSYLVGRAVTYLCISADNGVDDAFPSVLSAGHRAPGAVEIWLVAALGAVVADWEEVVHHPKRSLQLWKW